ncbi:MAG TPA: aminotransferase class III-fold pyridoxal phosphate-dependent enzyme [Verrucomicrobiae bacterium]|nr:aminotransferase class III-fold pyridoxal phosphate-dependent enzyme [Verrucomicrobiae bacterium]
MSLPVSDAPRFTAPGAARIAEEVFGVRGTAEPLPSERDQNFLVRAEAGGRFVLKIANSGERKETLDFQNALIERLAERCPELRFPRVVQGIKKEGPFFLRMLTWVEGACMAAVSPHSDELLASLGRALGRIDRALEGFAHEAAHRTLHWDIRHACLSRQHLALLPDHRRRIVEAGLDECARVDWRTLRHGIIHGDANDYNVLADGGRVVSILDFGDAVHTATVCDLAIAVAYAMLGKRDPIAAARCVVEAYHAEYPLTEPEADSLFALAVARLCLSVCYSAHHAQTAPHNEYLGVTDAPAWSLLERLNEFPECWPRDVFRRACGFMRGRTAAALLEARKEHLGPSLSLSYRKPLHITHGWRQRMFDAEGRGYLDCVNNVSHVGHCHPRVAEAAARQMRTLNTNTRYLHEDLAEYIERLTATLPPPLTVAYLVCSGSEANELALRLARAHTGRDDVIVVDTAYHGNTNALIDISPYKFNGPGGRGKPAHVQVVPMPDVYRRPACGPGEVRDAVGRANGVAAFFCESALSCAGQIILPPGYLREAFATVREAGGVCVADEVQTGFGRAGSHFWMFQTQGVVPDIVTLGKPIGNGHPMGAVITTPQIAASFANGMEYFNTFGGNPVSCAVGLAVLDVIRDEGLQENARETGEYLLAGLKDLAGGHPMIGDVRGQGLFIGIEFVRDRETREPAAEEAAAIVEDAREHGILLSTDGPFHNVIKIKPPLVFTRTDAALLLGEISARAADGTARRDRDQARDSRYPG